MSLALVILICAASFILGVALLLLGLRGNRSLDNYTPGGVLGNAIAFNPTVPILTDSGTYFQYRDPTNGSLVVRTTSATSGPAGSAVTWPNGSPLGL